MPRLHDFYRSSAAYRVRIALNIKGLSYEAVPHDLRSGDHRAADYLDINPQGAVPALEIDGAVLTQSSAIIEYLEERYSDPPLLPSDPLGRARVRGLYQLVVTDIHPLTTIRVSQYLGDQHDFAPSEVQLWQQHWISSGFDALETLLATSRFTGRFSHGDSVTLADIALAAQSFTAARLDVSVDTWPTIARIVKAAATETAFRDAHPDHVVNIERTGA